MQNNLPEFGRKAASGLSALLFTVYPSIAAKVIMGTSSL